MLQTSITSEILKYYFDLYSVSKCYKFCHVFDHDSHFINNKMDVTSLKSKCEVSEDNCKIESLNVSSLSSSATKKGHPIIEKYFSLGLTFDFNAAAARLHPTHSGIKYAKKCQKFVKLLFPKKIAKNCNLTRQRTVCLQRLKSMFIELLFF